MFHKDYEVESNGIWQKFEQLQAEKFSNLENILRDGFDKLDDRLQKMGESFVDVATNKNVMQLDTVREMMEMQGKAYQSIVKVLIITFGLIVTVLVGLRYLAPHWFGG